MRSGRGCSEPPPLRSCCWGCSGAPGGGIVWGSGFVLPGGGEKGQRAWDEWKLLWASVSFCKMGIIIHRAAEIVWWNVGP